MCTQIDYCLPVVVLAGFLLLESGEIPIEGFEGDSTYALEKDFKVSGIR